MSKKRASRVQELFLRGVALPPGRRGDWLDSVCGSDDELRSELISLLEHHREDTLFRDLPSSSEVRIDRTPTGGLPWRRWFEAPWRGVWVCLIALLLLTGVYFFAVWDMERAIRDRVGQGLEAVLRGYDRAVARWIDERQREVEAWAKDPSIVEHVNELVVRGEELLLEGDAGRDELRALDAHRLLRERMQPLVDANPNVMYSLLNRNGFVLSSVERFEPQFGLPPDERIAAYVAGIFKGDVRFLPPTFFDDWFLEALPDQLINEASTWCNAPVRDGDRVVAALGFGLPASQFNEIFETGEFFETADIYAFDVAGLLVSDPLRSTRLIPEEEAEGLGPYQRVRLVRDPGGDLSAGFEPTLAPEARPLTRLAHEAITSRFDEESVGHGRVMEPYRDYRGVEVVGAWSWLDEHGIGLAAEIEASEALAPVSVLRSSFGWLYVVLTLALLFTLFLALRAHRARRGRTEGARLGPYTLLRPIGEGGVGRVYLASHALLRRESAVKLLREDQLSNETRVRFEREVQLASQLEHPNTIQVHDYGHTDDGTFYYAMEYLKGENLAQLVQREGPMEPQRVVHVMRQVCGSLREAHERGLIHRDIKPQNVMLGTRAGVADVVKVLDFGLAKDLESAEDQDFTRMARISGTPLYMAPERIRDPRHTDRRVDIYAVGALAHFLLTGRRMFDAESDLALVDQVLSALPPPLRTGVAGDPSPELAALVARCLAKDRDERPDSMAELLAALDACPEAAPRPPSAAGSARPAQLADRTP